MHQKNGLLAVLASALTLNAANVTLFNNLGAPVQSYDYVDPAFAPSNADFCPCYSSFSNGPSSASLTDVVLELQLVSQPTETSITVASGRSMIRHRPVSTGAARHITSVRPQLTVGSITVALYSDSGGSPGSLIGAIGSLSDTALTNSPATYDFPLGTPIPLAANTRYWISVTTSSASQGGWDWSNSGSGTGVSGEFFWDDGGPSAANGSSPFIMQVTVSQNAPPATPAPASLLLMLTAAGLGGLYFARRRFARARQE